MFRLFLFILFLKNFIVLQIETQDYRVIDKIDNVEIRFYPSVMKVKSFSILDNGNFSSLFRYISGFNDQKKKIAMTTPVYIEKINRGSIMEFVLPKKYSLNNTPIAKNSDLQVYQKKEVYCASISYGGYTNEQKEKYFGSKLLNILELNSIKTLGKPKILVYNSPYKFFNRKNEILVEVDYK